MHMYASYRARGRIVKSRGEKNFSLKSRDRCITPKIRKCVSCRASCKSHFRKREHISLFLCLSLSFDIATRILLPFQLEDTETLLRREASKFNATFLCLENRGWRERIGFANLRPLDREIQQIIFSLLTLHLTP